jgi:hypothetical protein
MSTLPASCVTRHTSSISLDIPTCDYYSSAFSFPVLSPSLSPALYHSFIHQPDLVPCKLFEFDHLITKAKLEENDNFQDYVNPVTKIEVRDQQGTNYQHYVMNEGMES